MLTPAIQTDNATVYCGNNLEILPTLPDNSVDSIITDPPYELGFMGKNWDKSGIAYSVELWQECLRVLKPGGHLLAFGGSRTWHRLAVAIEDAGFEMRDSIAWIYGSGFPKSHNISKAIDKLHGAERKVVGSRPLTGNGKTMKSGFHQPDGSGAGETVKEEVFEFTEPATDEAKQWDGWGTALKPAFEPIVVARKPLIGTVAENVLQFGVGGINIDASRIAGEVPSVPQRNKHGYNAFGDGVGRSGEMSQPSMLGRWPANVILDETTAKILDEQSGNKVRGNAGSKQITNFTFGATEEKQKLIQGNTDIGGASRFFYVAKASKRDRNEGLDELPEIQTIGGGGTNAELNENGYLKTDSARGKYGSIKAAKQNFHPTVKPTTLMTYLIKLVTPANGVVLDPFTGSGSTGKASLLEGYTFIGIELTAEYLPIIKGRLKHAEQTKEAEQQDDLFS